MGFEKPESKVVSIGRAHEIRKEKQQERERDIAELEDLIRQFNKEHPEDTVGTTKWMREIQYLIQTLNENNPEKVDEEFILRVKENLQELGNNIEAFRSWGAPDKVLGEYEPFYNQLKQALQKVEE